MMQKTWKWLKFWYIGTYLIGPSKSYPINTNMAVLKRSSKKFCALVPLMKVASALKGLNRSSVKRWDHHCLISTNSCHMQAITLHPSFRNPDILVNGQMLVFTMQILSCMILFQIKKIQKKLNGAKSSYHHKFTALPSLKMWSSWYLGEPSNACFYIANPQLYNSQIWKN